MDEYRPRWEWYIPYENAALWPKDSSMVSLKSTQSKDREAEHEIYCIKSKAFEKILWHAVTIAGKLATPLELLDDQADFTPASPDPLSTVDSSSHVLTRSVIASSIAIDRTSMPRRAPTSVPAICASRLVHSVIPATHKGWIYTGTHSHSSLILFRVDRPQITLGYQRYWGLSPISIQLRSHRAPHRGGPTHQAARRLQVPDRLIIGQKSHFVICMHSEDAAFIGGIALWICIVKCNLCFTLVPQCDTTPCWK
jgi:hypothetical protein